MIVLAFFRKWFNINGNCWYILYDLSIISCVYNISLTNLTNVEETTKLKAFRSGKLSIYFIKSVYDMTWDLYRIWSKITISHVWTLAPGLIFKYSPLVHLYIDWNYKLFFYLNQHQISSKNGFRKNNFEKIVKKFLNLFC